MLRTVETEYRVYKNSLHYLLNFSVNLKLFQKIFFKKHYCLLDEEYSRAEVVERGRRLGYSWNKASRDGRDQSVCSRSDEK